MLPVQGPAVFNNPSITHFNQESTSKSLKNFWIVLEENDNTLLLNITELFKRSQKIPCLPYFIKAAMVLVMGQTRYIDGRHYQKGSIVDKGAHKVCRQVKNLPLVTLKQVINDDSFKRDVLVKKRELEIHTHLKKHTNICKIFETFVMPSRKRQGIIKIITFAEAYSSDLFELRKSLGALEIFSILIDITKAIKFCHDQKVIIGDIKLENILLGNGKAVLTDFGNATLEGPRQKFNTYTACYASPELRFGPPANVTRSSDIFSWGLMMELLNGSNVTIPYRMMKRSDLEKNYVNYISCIDKYREYLIPSPYRRIIHAMMDPEASKRVNIDSVLEYLNQFTRSLP